MKEAGSREQGAGSREQGAGSREKSAIVGAGYGGHFRAVQGFKYITPCES